MDDFTQIRSGTAVVDLLTEIAEYRFSNQRPTIWTCNLNLEVNERLNMAALKDQYGISFARRLQHSSKPYIVNEV